MKRERFFEKLEDARSHEKLLEDAGMVLNPSGKLKEGEYVTRFEYHVEGAAIGNVKGATVHWHDRS